MMDYRETYYFTGKCLSIDRYPERVKGIADTLTSGNVNWELFVWTASNHLVLQTIFVKFRKHDLLRLLPEDLTRHLEYVHSLNSDRNKNIRRHLLEINSKLTAEGIVPVFMKGAGNLLDALYGDEGERLMQDVDILVSDSEMEKAAGVLLDNGFSSKEEYDGKYRIALKHYPQLWKEALPAPLELHRLPVSLDYEKIFGYGMVNSGKRRAKAFRECFVMSDRHKVIHNFIHTHLMHLGYLHTRIFLRDMYDMMLLSERDDPGETLAGFGHYRRKAAGYLRVVSKVLGTPLVTHQKMKGKGRFFSYRHNKLLKAGYLSKVFFLLVRYLQLYITLPAKALWDRRYRLFVAKRLGSPQWYGRHIKGYREKFGSNREKFGSNREKFGSNRENFGNNR